jgi:hypothetical protein
MEDGHHGIYSVTKLILMFLGVVASVAIAIYGQRAKESFSAFSVATLLQEADMLGTISTFDSALYKRLDLRLDGVPLKKLKIVMYTIRNEGTKPVLPADFIEPLILTVKQPWKILNVTKFASEPQSGLKLTWERRTDQSWVMKPVLFNPGDASTVVAYAVLSSSNSPVDQGLDSSRGIFSYTARILNIASLNPRREESSFYDKMYTSVVLQRGQVYLFVFLYAALVSLFLILATSGSTLPRFSMWHGALLLSGVVLSMTTAEITVSLFSLPAKAQWPGSWFLLALHGLLLLYLLIRAIIEKARPQVGLG